MTNKKMALKFYVFTYVTVILSGLSDAYYDFYWQPWNVTIPGWHHYKYFEEPSEPKIVRQYVLQEENPR